MPRREGEPPIASLTVMPRLGLTPCNEHTKPYSDETEGLQGLMSAGLLGAAMPQPIDDCLKTLGDLMVAGPLSAPVMSSSWQPVDLLGRFQGGEAKVNFGTPPPPPPPSSR